MQDPRQYRMGLIVKLTCAADPAVAGFRTSSTPAELILHRSCKSKLMAKSSVETKRDVKISCDDLVTKYEPLGVPTCVPVALASNPKTLSQFSA